MKNVLLATHVKFWMESDGSSKRVSSLLKYISERSNLTTVYYAGFVEKKTIEVVLGKYPNIKFFADNYNHKIRKTKIIKKISYAILSLISSRYKYGYFFGKIQPRGFAGKYTTYRKRYFNKIVKSVEPENIIVEYISMAYLIEDIYKLNMDKPKLLVDTHDILYLRCQSFKSRGLQHWVDISKGQEVEYLNKFDVVMAIQNKEKEEFEKILSKKKVINVPFPYVVTKTKQRSNFPLKVGYVGAGGSSNVDAISNFIENIWPFLRHKYGDSLSLEIYGAIGDALKRYGDFDGINIHGKFDDLEHVYDALDIVVNPVLSGGGLKIKNIEALCHSLPLVTTSCGAQGLEEAMNDAFFCCDANSEQISKISELVDNFDLRQRVSEKAYQYARKNFNEDKCYSELMKIIG